MLFERGSNVYIPRLPRHGLADRLTTELEALTAAELRAFARESVESASQLGERLVVVGFSVGGLLSAWIAEQVAVERAACIAPFLGFPLVPRRLTGSAARVALAMPNQFVWWDPLARERQMPVHGYPRFATHAVAEAAQLAGEVLLHAERGAPLAREVQIVLNARETAVSNRAARTLVRRWRSHGGDGVLLHRLEGLPLSHDIIEPLRSPDIVRRIYPELVRLVDR